MLKRIWNSPTLTTWMSYSTQTLTLLGVLPLVLKKFPVGDVVLWYLFATILTLQNVADFGFRQTFSRVISYAYGGAEDIGIFGVNSEKTVSNAGPNRQLLSKIVSIMKWIYIRLSVILFLLLLIFGTWAMKKPIADTSSVNQSWIAWAIVLLTSCISFYCKSYMAFLEGLFKIAVVRRVETLTSLGSIISSIVVLIYSPTLLHLVIVNQFWVLVVALRDLYLCRTVDDRIYRDVSKKTTFGRDDLMQIWQPAWRSGISGFMSVGLTNLTGIIYAQTGNSVLVASYLVAFRFIDQIKTVSMAPLYSKIPLLARLRVQGKLNELVRIVKRSMLMSHFVYISGFIIVGIFSASILKLIHSNVPFVSQNLWILIGFAFFIHRYGAMHIQVYLSTNHVISHIADGVSGILYIVSALLLSKYIGVYAIPVGLIIGYLGFYSWYAAGYSYKSMKVNFWKFEKKAALLPAAMLQIYIIAVFLKEYVLNKH